MKVFFASDHGGYDLKNDLISKLKKSYDIQDLGPYSLNSEDDYPDFAEKAANEVNGTTDSRAVLICKSGNGMCIAANKFKGIRAALCVNKIHAQKAREDNDANILCLDSTFTDHDETLEIVNTFLETNFSNESRHQRRINKIKKIEDRNFA